MKATSWITAAVALAALLVAGALSSCTTVTQETVSPDGSKITTKTVTVDPATATAIANAAANAALEKSKGNGK